MEEDKKPDKEEMLHSEKLLSLVNEAAVRLLMIEIDKFEIALTDSMEKMALCMDVDCVHIWRANEQDGNQVYTILHSWISPSYEKNKIFEKEFETRTIPRATDWDDRLLNKQGYLSEYSREFQDPIRSMLVAQRNTINYGLFCIFPRWVLGLCII